MEGLIKGEFSYVGENEINENFVCEKWNHLWFISKYHSQYRIIKHLRRDSPITSVKLTISEVQAISIIDKLNLSEVKCEMLNYASSFKRMKDMEMLRDWRIKKHGLNRYTAKLA